MRDVLLIAKSFNNLKRIHVESTHFVRENPSLHSRIWRSLDAFHTWYMLKPWNLLSELHDLFPYMMARKEVDASYWLADIGFYRHAIAALRTTLELAVLAANFARDERASRGFSSWVNGLNHPGAFKRDMLRPLFANPRFRRVGRELPLQQDIEELYGVLCKYAHSQGAPHSIPGLAHASRVSTARYALSASALKEYSKYLQQVTRAAVMLAFIRNPLGMQELPVYEKFPWDRVPPGMLPPNVRDAARSVLVPREVRVLQTLSDNDLGVQWMVQQVRALPDLSSNWNWHTHFDTMTELFREYEERSLAAE